MNRLEIFLLNKTAETFVKFSSIESLMRFFHNTGHVNRYYIIVHVGAKALYIENIDATSIQRELADFQNKNPQ